MAKARVTGIGGIFLRAKDPKALGAWYAEHLGIALEHGYAAMKWTDELPKGTGVTAWSLYPADTDHFGPSGQTAMINYRVDDLDALIAQLTEAGIPVDPKRDEYSFGRFAWITDPEGNKVELWQPLVSVQEG